MCCGYLCCLFNGIWAPVMTWRCQGGCQCGQKSGGCTMEFPLVDLAARIPFHVSGGGGRAETLPALFRKPLGNVSKFTVHREGVDCTSSIDLATPNEFYRRSGGGHGHWRNSRSLKLKLPTPSRYAGTPHLVSQAQPSGMRKNISYRSKRFPSIWIWNIVDRLF